MKNYLLIIVCCLASLGHAQPVRLIAEAEDFTVKSGWQVLPYRENYFASTFAITFLSRMGCLSAAEQAEAVAEQVIEVPVAGEYELLARYEQPFNYSCEFAVEIEQGGRVVGRSEFGRLADPKIWAMNKNQPAPMVRYWWGSTDNIVWQNPGKFALAAGKATLRLITGKQAGVRAAKRNVDVVMLTTDKAGLEAQLQHKTYLPFDGWLVQDGDLFVRFTNPADSTNACMPVVAPLPMGQHSPYYVHLRDWPTTRVLKSGRLIEPTKYQMAGPRSLAVPASQLAPVVEREKFVVDPAAKKPKFKIPEDEYLKPGEMSGWVPLGPVLDALHNCKWEAKAESKAKGGELYLKIEFAVPDGKGGLTTIKETTMRGKTVFEMPGNIRPNAALAAALRERFWLPEIRTQQEALQWLSREVAKFPKVGAPAKRFPIYNILRFSDALDKFAEARELATALGDTTGWKPRSIAANWQKDTLPGKPLQKQNLAGISVVSYGDEMHLPAAQLTDEEFAAWLAAKGIKTDAAPKWTKNHADALYYYSVIAGVEKGAQPYIEASAYYATNGILAGANYSPHSNYLVSEMHWVRPFKLNALSLAWSEDYVWQVPEFSVQVVGYLTTAFRAGTKYHNQPIMMYVMPHSPGTTPGNFRRSFYTCLAHGMKQANFFCATPLAVGTTENYIATEDLAMWREIYNCSHEAGLFEDYVLDGQVRPAKVGLLLSSVDDVLGNFNNQNLALHNNERKAIYYALRHAQVPVDMLSEDDVIDGLAKDYQVIYVTQQWLHSKCLAALRAWVAKGGTVVALCGGGFRDEFNQLNPQANEFYGVGSQEITADPQLVSKYLLVENKPFLVKQDLPGYEPLDYVGQIPVIAWKQILAPNDGRVIGVFKDNGPAIIEKEHGEGKVVLYGFLPGQAYLKSGLPARPVDRGATAAGFNHFLPTAMDPELRRQLVDQFLPKNFVRPVVCSEPLVESAIIDSAGKIGIPLINYTGQPLEKLTVKVAGVATAKSVRSLERGLLKPTFEGDQMTVELPVNVADMLLIDR
ncbi:MAG: hypothetical protein PCFJNLEI_02094 [Verrucomicrobiae bacterium]|nr:hypothetical protein [Verrucomicrobiae bacterium]